MNRQYSLSNTRQKLENTAKKAWFSTARIAEETLAPDTKAYQIGQIYGIYRMLVGLFLVLTNYVANEAIKSGLSPADNLFSSQAEYLILGFYLVFAIAASLILYSWRQHIRRQLLAGFVIDMIVLTALLYSGTTKDIQISLLYMVAIAASFMVLRLRHALSVTMIAVVSLIFQQIVYVYNSKTSFLSLSDSLILSLALFAVGFLSWSVSQRLAIAETVAHDNAQEVKRLNAINEEVIKNMVNGVIVVGRTGRLLIINQTAEELLRLPAPKLTTSPLAYNFEIERQLNKKYKAMVDWYQHEQDETLYSLTLEQQKDLPQTNIRIHKKNLPEYGQLLILEDISREESHAQQLKLASLGQLSASIAHEIRNPLGAISQASELLMEDANSTGNDNHDLLRVIYNQSQRVNRIIEDVLRLSRQEPPKQQPITLQSWLPAFIEQHYPDKDISLNFKADGRIYFDPHHLEQIFINLINNALRHTKSLPSIADVSIAVHQSKHSILVDVIDNGDGVNRHDIPNLFNPFFTKSIGGTGLGLYLSKAFSEANHARLIYLPDEHKTCFRLMVPPFG